MSAKIEILLVNETQNTINFYIFQEPATFYSPSLRPDMLYTSVISSVQVEGGAGGLATAIDIQFFAGATKQEYSPIIHQPPHVTQISTQPIAVTPPPGDPETTNTTTVSTAERLWLSEAYSTDGPPSGAFRFVCEDTFQPEGMYWVGLVQQSVLSSFVSSSYVLASLDCQPIMKYYVGFGQYWTAGTPIDFASASATAALCDATTGNTSFEVKLNADSTWTVTSPAPAATTSRGRRGD